MSSATITWIFVRSLHILSLIPLFHASFPINGICHDKCGDLPINFPLGSGFGCRHPDLARYIKCSSKMLQFSTETGTYTVSTIEYFNSSLIVTDPLMSNCTSMQNSGSFLVDQASPLNIALRNTFVLFGCSRTSPLFDLNLDLCDTGSDLHICRGLYSCKVLTGIGLEPNAAVSSCCVYQPTFAASDYMLDLPKLQCSSYASIYGFRGDEGDPMIWEFGISLYYNNSYYAETCKNCEASGGYCSFAGLQQSFASICH